MCISCSGSRWCRSPPLGPARTHFAPAPTALYGVSLLMPAIAYYVLQLAIIRHQGPESALKRAIGRDLKGKISPVMYLAAIALAFVLPWMSYALYVAVALMWPVLDRRIERGVNGWQRQRRG
jgi:uncharacterized membrane protein